MTTNQNSVFARTATPASAIQARASSQGAAIALLGAGTSPFAQSENSFAQSLESEAKRQTTPAGLFSDSSSATKVSSRTDRLRTNESRRNDTDRPGPASARGPESNTDAIEDSDRPVQTDGDEPGSHPSTTSHDFSVQHTVENAPPTNGLSPATTASTSNEQSNAAEEEAAARQPKPGAAEQKSRQPTDPLRLIAPQQQPAPAEDSAVGSKAATQSSVQVSAAAQSSANQATTRASENTSKSIGPAPQTGSVNSSGVGATLRTGIAAAETPNSASASIATVGAASGASGIRQGGAPIDQVAPPRVGGSHPIEQPVVLKLKVTPPASGSSIPLSETEIKAAETQIGRGLTAAFRQNTPQVTLWMSPETLGKVRIHLTFDQGTISARFEATSQATKELLSQNMGALREALQSRGLTAQQIEVVSIPDWSNQTGSQSGGNPGREASDQPPQQSSTGGNPSGQGGQPQQGNPEHSRAWASVATLDNTVHQSLPASEAQISLTVNPRLMNLQAHLELDALA
ncbi:MAG: flagellar hook-length control protein FliK [Phycisphaeraceae bacterium]|nr:flagellar hook-length control protein FliK [Phycisphaeraceae bacterium]